MQRSRGVPSRPAANRKRSGAGLPAATWMALKTCGSKKRSRPVTASLSRTRTRWPFEATQRGRGRALSNSSTPGDRLQLALQDQGRAGPHGLEELVRERAPEAALDGGAEGRAVLAE